LLKRSFYVVCLGLFRKKSGVFLIAFGKKSFKIFLKSFKNQTSLLWTRKGFLTDFLSIFD